jgi:mannose-6-phosphate isomerase-like protein (cupin superfamily)
MKGGTTMTGYSVDIERATEENGYFRHVLLTAGHMQLVVMSLLPREDIGQEMHPDVDQFIRIEKGHGEAILNGTAYKLREGTAIIIPAGTEHNVINTSHDKPMRLYTIYSPPNHHDGTIHRTKTDAEAYELAEHAR